MRKVWENVKENSFLKDFISCVALLMMMTSWSRKMERRIKVNIYKNEVEVLFIT